MQPLPRQSARILITEDNMVNQEAARLLLESAGYRVSTAETAADTFRQLESFRPDLLLVDVNLPDMDGLSMVRQIRQRYSTDNNLAVIFLTSAEDTQTRHDALCAGANDFLSKPFDPAELLARIGNNVDTKLLQDALTSANRRFERERDEIAQIQRRLLPSRFPTIDGFVFHGGYVPCGKAGGDYYDAIQRLDGSILMIVADVSGHGLPAAVHMSMARAIIHAQARDVQPLTTVFDKLNHVLTESFQPGEFMTCFLALLNPQTLEMESLNAGHPSPLLLHRETMDVEQITGVGCPPVGVEGPSKPVTSLMTLEKSQRLLLFTDGLVEERDPVGEFFGEDQVEGLLMSHASVDAEEFGDALLSSVREHCQRPFFRDDVTFLIIDTPE